MKKKQYISESFYSKNFDPKLINDPNTSYAKITKLINGQPKSILDVGCSTGCYGSFLKNKYQAIVWGIETYKNDADLAQEKLDHVVSQNLEHITQWDKIFTKTKFDLIVCADVLEHLQNPWLFVAKLKTLLNPKGQIIASIPNGTHYSIKINLLSNSWPYQSFGLMDKTHFHFFPTVKLLVSSNRRSFSPIKSILLFQKHQQMIFYLHSVIYP